MMTKKLIGILGGTFDPIHNAHLHIAQHLLNNLPLTEVRFIPSKTPVHRDPPLASTEQRLDMVKLAIREEERFVIDTREIDRDTPSYMIETLQSLRDEVKDTSLALILGLDVFCQLDTWHQWKDLITYAHIIVVNRPEYPNTFSQPIQQLLDEHQVEDAHKLFTQSAGCIFFIGIPPSTISATTIREHITNGESIKNLVPESVWQYINTQELYIVDHKN